MEFKDECNKIISLLADLSTVSFEVGIFEEDANIEQIATIKNFDGTESKITSTVGDIMYLTEYGTINIPGKELLTNILKDILLHINPLLSDLTDKILNGSINSSTEILIYLEVMLSQINNEVIQRSINNTLAQLNNINTLIESNQDTNYIYDISKLSRYIKCKINYSF